MSERLDRISALVEELQTEQVPVETSEALAAQARIAAKGLWRFAESCEAMTLVDVDTVKMLLDEFGFWGLVDRGAVRLVHKQLRRL